MRIKDQINAFSGTEKPKTVVQELLSDGVFLERLHLRMIARCFDIDNVHVVTKLGAKQLKNTSFGERCGIVIAIVLVAGTNPIIIDQPEDHLDGKFISSVLVPLIRQQKTNRQIILITRDANIVVGGDAELIHILETQNNTTTITPSTLENTTCRERYIWILDGGAEAFANREQKYEIAQLIAKSGPSGASDDAGDDSAGRTGGH